MRFTGRENRQRSCIAPFLVHIPSRRVVKCDHGVTEDFERHKRNKIDHCKDETVGNVIEN
jgi:hypothetical protein